MTIETRIKKLLAEQIGEHPDNISNTHELLAHLGFDSLDIVEIMMAMEQEFAIDIDDDQFIALKTVQQVIDHVHARTGATA